LGPVLQKAFPAHHASCTPIPQLQSQSCVLLVTQPSPTATPMATLPTEPTVPMATATRATHLFARPTILTHTSRRRTLPSVTFFPTCRGSRLLVRHAASAERDRRCARAQSTLRIHARRKARLGSIANFVPESTLREGEQFANAYFDLEAKIKIAKALDEFGVDCTALLRGTWPATPIY
jgi:hypothetical protein